jgi:hypothetical protein
MDASLPYSERLEQVKQLEQYDEGEQGEVMTDVALIPPMAVRPLRSLASTVRRWRVASKDDAAEAAEIERRVRAAAVEPVKIPSYCPQTGDLVKLFRVGRGTVHSWFTEGYENEASGLKIELRYWTLANGWRAAYPSDVVAILDDTRKLRSASNPKGVEPIAATTCPTCGQALPATPE